MKKLLILLITLTTVSSSWGFNLGASAGYHITSSDKFKNSFYTSIYADFDLIPMIDLRIQGTYAKAESEKGKVMNYSGTADLTTYGGAVLLKATAPIPLVNLYGALGYGYYNNEFEIPNHKKSRIGHGITAQAGVGINILLLYLGLEAAYVGNNTSYTDLSGTNIAFILGVSF